MSSNDAVVPIVVLTKGQKLALYLVFAARNSALRSYLSANLPAGVTPAIKKQNAANNLAAYAKNNLGITITNAGDLVDYFDDNGAVIDSAIDSFPADFDYDPALGDCPSGGDETYVANALKNMP